MLQGIVSMICNIVYFIVLNMTLYTDTAILPNGQMRVMRRSPVDRLYAADMPAWLYAQLVLAAISLITGVMLLLGIQRQIIKKVQMIATVASTAVFIAIMIITANSHVKYA